jgi:molybdopterin synthase sulfur carrier subunit
VGQIANLPYDTNMNVYIPTPLRSYTNKNIVQADGATLAELFADLDRKFPGIRFRVINEQDQIREHIKIFINQSVADGLNAPLHPNDTVHIIAAISGG